MPEGRQRIQSGMVIGVDEVETHRLMTDAGPAGARSILHSLPERIPWAPPVSWKRIACTMFGLNFWLNGRADRLAGTTALGKPADIRS